MDASTSRRRGQRRSTTLPPVRMVAARMGSTLFFAPCMVTSPWRRFPPRISSRLILLVPPDENGITGHSMGREQLRFLPPLYQKAKRPPFSRIQGAFAVYFSVSFWILYHGDGRCKVRNSKFTATPERFRKFAGPHPGCPIPPWPMPWLLAGRHPAKYLPPSETALPGGICLQQNLHAA